MSDHYQHSEFPMWAVGAMLSIVIMVATFGCLHLCSNYTCSCTSRKCDITKYLIQKILIWNLRKSRDVLLYTTDLEVLRLITLDLDDA